MTGTGDEKTKAGSQRPLTLREIQNKSQSHSWDTCCHRATPTVGQDKSIPNPLMFFFPAEVMDSEPPSESPVTMSLCLQSGLQPVWVAVASVTSGLTWSLGPRVVFLVFPCTAACLFLLGYANSLILYKNKKRSQYI